MPFYAAYGLDVPDGARIREGHRDAHHAYIVRDVSHLRFASALVDDRGRQIGTLYIIEADSMAEAEAWLHEEPWVKNHLFESFPIREIEQHAPWVMPARLEPDAASRLD
ncbi:YciI family protein [Rhizorhabdus dicambivorans]|uniref:YCII-related domain-containing protein n=1 Tax=Rhizorhabdus dicambivorans TaxID=1850238 RepID=A0A2A4FYI1_9SPHN|nr:YciI family protein [Rhizorhabdus dicambivorans]ATE63102.1 hypothetical protein CMV14_00725 [Rhizorhabdus dicambivorans]PCE43278.1 hypothetical protein COO09_05760 [Rhizorhabdus dicambivorans]